MATMTAATGLPWGRPLVRDDLDRMPDDGHRYELLDGSLLVSPAPPRRMTTARTGAGAGRSGGGARRR
jgi:hypothetical protein